MSAMFSARATIETSKLPYESPSAAADLAAASRRAGQRLMSLDVFRGITIAAMLVVNNPGVGKAYAPLGHADWHGWTPTDLIFPFFLFIVGVALPFSLSKRAAEAKQTRGQLLAHVWLRALSLFMLGQLLVAIPLSSDAVPDGRYVFTTFRILCLVFVYASILALLVPWRWKRLAAWLPPIVCVSFYFLAFVMSWLNQRAIAGGLPGDFNFGSGIFGPERMRIPGVLQRIGICYGIAATVALFVRWRMILLTCAALLFAYSALMLKARFPGHVTGSLTKEDNLARAIDETVLNKYVTQPDGTRKLVYRHAYSAYPDNEGILSTIPAIGTALLGIVAGTWLRTNRATTERCAALLAIGMIVTIFGACLDWWLMPINKIIWTPSYVVFTAGLAMLVLGTVFWVVDVLGKRRWALPLVIFGTNSIAAFVLAGVIPRVGSMIRIRADHGVEERVRLTTFASRWLADTLHGADDWLQSVSSCFPPIDGPGNTSLAYAFAFTFVVFAVLSLMYVTKVFVKV
jgi:predicted acyltransferase